MPELPEVETIRRDLAAAVVGRRVVRAEVLDASLVHAPTVEAFSRDLFAQVVEGVGRRGKYLLVQLDGSALVLHLMMSGRVFLRPADDPVTHTRLVVVFDEGPALHFVDTRRFGRAWLLQPPALADLMARLGPEPLESGFDGRTLHAAVAKRRRAIKPTLLDQRIVAGVGNIYADEALWLARIHPDTPAASLSRRRLDTLAQAIVTTLRAGIEHGGTSFRTYVGSRGQRGQYQERLNVFQRTGEPCPRCGHAIKRLVIGQRGTHICPRCQRRRT